MNLQSPQDGHSSTVEMELIAEGRAIRIAQLGPDFLIVDEPVELAPGRAEIEMRVDAETYRWPVELPDGLSLDSTTGRISTAERATVS